MIDARAHCDSHVRLFLLAAFAMLSFDVAAQQPTTIRPDLGSAQHIADWNLDGSGTWDVTAKTLRLTGAGTPGGPIRRPAGTCDFQIGPADEAHAQKPRSNRPRPWICRFVMWN